MAGEAALRLVLIEWQDSAQPAPGWTWLADGEWASIVTCQSVGWLVHDGAEVKALAPNKGELGNDGQQVSGVIRIPARCIVRTVCLQETATS